MYILSKHCIVLHKYILNVPIIFKSSFLSLDKSNQPDLWFMMNNSHHMAVCVLCVAQSLPTTGASQKLIFKRKGAMFCS